MLSKMNQVLPQGEPLRRSTLEEQSLRDASTHDRQAEALGPMCIQGAAAEIGEVRGQAVTGRRGAAWRGCKSSWLTPDAHADSETVDL